MTSQHPGKLKLNTFAPVFWILYFIITFRLFARFPAGNIEEILFIVIALVIILFCGYEFLTQGYKGRISHIFFIVLPLLILPFINAVQAHKVFGQPVLYGILAQRQTCFILSSWFIVIALRRKLISIPQLEKYFLWSMYIILAIMYFFYVFIDPSIFADTEFVKYTLSKGWVYKFPNGVTAGLLIYAFVKIIHRDRLRYLIPFAVCLWYFIYYGQDRSQLVFIGITLALLYANTVSVRRKLFYGTSAVLLIALAAVVVGLYNPALYDKYIELYSNASDIVNKSSSSESSTNIRFVEAVIATQGFRDHPLLGNGLLSNQWHDGYFRYYKYFYPSDVGILGNLYVFGIIGTLFYYIPFVFVLAWSLKLRKVKDAVFLTGVYGSLFIFLDMITAASNLTFIGLPAFFFGIVYYYRFYLYNSPQQPA